MKGVVFNRAHADATYLESLFQRAHADATHVESHLTERKMMQLINNFHFKERTLMQLIFDTEHADAANFWNLPGLVAEQHCSKPAAHQGQRASGPLRSWSVLERRPTSAVCTHGRLVAIHQPEKAKEKQI